MSELLAYTAPEVRTVKMGCRSLLCGAYGGGSTEDMNYNGGYGNGDFN